MADKQHDTAKDAGGQKGVSQEQVGSGKDKDPNNFAKKPGTRFRGREEGRPAQPRPQMIFG